MITLLSHNLKATILKQVEKMIIQNPLTKQRGISLIIVLWMLVILTVIALAFSQSIRTEIQLTANNQNQAKAQLLAEAGIWRAAAMALAPASSELGSEQLRLDGHVYSLLSEAGELKVSIQLAGGLIDINRTTEEIIKALLASTIASPEQVVAVTDSLLDWRDEDSLKRLSGAESNDYSLAGYSYAPSNGPMNSVAEFARVFGMTPEIYHDVEAALTVYSGRSRVDINSAPRPVLLALPAMTEALVDTIIASRSAGLETFDLTRIPLEARKFIAVNQRNIVKISSYAKVNNTISGIIAELDLASKSKKPIVVLSWRQKLNSIFKEKMDAL